MKEQGWAEEDDGQKHRADDEDENVPLESLKVAIMDCHRLSQVTSECFLEGSRWEELFLFFLFFMFTSIVLMNNWCKRQSMEGLDLLFSVQLAQALSHR